MRGKKIPKTSRITRQTEHSNLLPILTDISDFDDDMYDLDFVLPAVESDDDAIIESGG